MADIKTILLSTMRNGKEVIKENEYAKKLGGDFRVLKGRVKENVEKYHKKSIDVVISEIKDNTTEAKTFRFVSEDGSQLPIFEAGQFINIFVKVSDNVITSRPYSLSSSPTQRGYYEVTIAKAKDGFISNFMLEKAKVGDKFTINGPSGVFTYCPVYQDKHSVFLAGGSGVTPFVSMVKEIIERGQTDRHIDFIFGCRRPEIAISHDELEKIAKQYKNINYHLIVSDDIPTKHKKGFITADLIKEIVKEVEKPTFFICGPPVMSKFVTKELEKLKIKSKNIKKETFGARQDIQNEDGWPKELAGNEIFKIKINGNEIPAKSNETVLQALERAGIHNPVSCRTGVCSMCRVKLVSGEVFVPEGVLTRYADDKYGYIHSCKTYPISNIEIKI